MKRNHRKRNPAVLSAAALTGIVICISLGACGRRPKEPVVAEKTTEAGSLSPSLSESVQETIGGNQGESSGGTGSQPLSSLVEAPERYRAEVRGEHAALTADAEIIIPDAVSIPVFKAETVPYSEGDYTHFKRITEAAAGIRWGEDTIESRQVSNLSEDGSYFLSFVDGTMEGTTPILWMHSRLFSAGSSADFNSADISGLTLTDEEKKQTENKITEKAQELLGQLNAGSFVLKSCRWRHLLETNAAKQRTASGQYGLQLKYVRLHQGIPVTGSVPSLLGTYVPSAQYVELLYHSDGTLLVVKDIDRQKIDSEGENGRFLLPFASVSEIFEQYCKTYYNDDNHTVPKAIVPNQTAIVENPVLIPYTDENHAAIKVTKVMLEYRFQRDPGAEEITKGKLIPVWNFYGSLELWGQNQTRDGLLVSIHAEDGTIYGD